MKRRLCACLFFLLLSVRADALDFPPLTGRVVDAAHILSPAVITNLEQSLAATEQQTGDQVVVATISSLHDVPIEEYGYQLGRAWGIGQKDKNNGAILIIAPHERRVRIEVGYGLEGVLTDAVSATIIQTVILPQFRQGQIEAGVVQGTYAILSTLGVKVDYNAPRSNGQQVGADGYNSLFIVLVWLVIFALRIFILPWWFPGFWMFPRGRNSGFGNSSFGGGFGGGGGSFGGGGASGGW